MGVGVGVRYTKDGGTSHQCEGSYFLTSLTSSKGTDKLTVPVYNNDRTLEKLTKDFVTRVLIGVVKRSLLSCLFLVINGTFGCGCKLQIVSLLKRSLPYN